MEKGEAAGGHSTQVRHRLVPVSIYTTTHAELALSLLLIMQLACVPKGVPFLAVSSNPERLQLLGRPGQLHGIPTTCSVCPERQSLVGRCYGYPEWTGATAERETRLVTGSLAPSSRVPKRFSGLRGLAWQVIAHPCWGRRLDLGP